MNKIHWETVEARDGMRAVVGSLVLPSGRKRIEYRLISYQEVAQARPSALKFHVSLIVQAITGAMLMANDREMPAVEAIRAKAYEAPYRDQFNKQKHPLW